MLRTRKVEGLEKSLALTTGGLLVARMALQAIADDIALECRCGPLPYTDGVPCPRCLALRVVEEVDF